MQIIKPSPEVVPFGLRALKMVATADGTFSDAERSLIDTALRFFGGGLAEAVDLDALPPILPAELAERLPDPAHRRQLVRAMVIVSIVDGEASPAEAAVVESFAEALGVKSPDLVALRDLAERHLVRARFDVARRFFAREKAIEYAKEKGLGWVLRSLAAMAGLREDATIAQRYLDLEHAPVGSLGRAYFDFVRGNQFTFPGERGSPPEVIVLHDLTHVLSGYGTDPEGELDVLAFHTGCRREEKDPFSFLLFGIAEFHLGLAMSPVAASARGKLDPERMFRALARGAACKIDPTDGWDFWAVVNEPLAALRERYGITPLS
ncbi:MAG: TerB family tellurite resistance protein [Polyangiaceae bacterium]